MTKRILSMVLVLAMVLSFVPAVVLAEGTGEVVASPKAGTHTDAGHSDDCGLTSGWKPWPGTEGTADTLPTSGQWYLTQDIAIAAGMQFKVESADLTLCLNGYVIKAAEDQRILSTSGAHTLTICDCTAYEENGVYYAGTLTGGKSVVSGGGGAIFVRRLGTLKLYDGIITGNQDAYNSTSGGGGAVALQGKDSSGNSAGKMYMYGGELSDNKACYKTSDTGRSGGAIWIGTGGTLEITGGTIQNNRAGAGGAIFGTASTVKLSNVTITGNEAYGTSDASGHIIGGSAIRAYGGMQLTIGDGTVITGNTSAGTSYGEGYGAAVLMGSASNKLTLTGKVFIADNTSPTTGVASVTFNKVDTDTLYVNELAAGSYVEFATPKTVPADADEVIALNGNQSSWSNGWVAFMDKEGNLKHIGYANGDFSFVDGHFHGDQEYQPLTSADELIAGGSYYLADNVELSKEARVAAGATTNLCLNGKELTSKSTNAIMGTTGTAPATVINVYDCTAYTDDQGVYHAGAITGGNNTSAIKSTGFSGGNGGGAFMIRANGTLNFYAGKITNNTAVVGGGAIFANGTVNLYGGEISGNKAAYNDGTKDVSKNGGAIYVNYSATSATNKGQLYAENVLFDNNQAVAGNGGAIYGSGQMTIKNCTFTNNSAKTGGAINGSGTQQILIEDSTFTKNTATAVSAINAGKSGIEVTLKNVSVTGNANTKAEPDNDGYGAVNGVSGATVKLAGKVVIQENTTDGKAENLHLQKDFAGVDVTGLTAGSDIGVSMLPTRVAAGQMTFSTASASNNKSYFTSDDAAYEVALNDDNQLELVEATTSTPPADAHKHTLCNDTGCTEHTTEVEYKAWGDDEEEKGKLPTDGNWYLADDITVSAETKIETATTLNLCLNGKTITGFSGKHGRAYSTTVGTATVINISDCTAKTTGDVYSAGSITGFTNTSTGSGGGAIFVRAASTVTLYDGIITGNKSYGAGGGVMVSGTFNMYDGRITDNESVQNSAKTNNWDGGGMYINTTGAVNLYGGQISENKGENGAGIYNNGGKVVLGSVSITGNQGTINGAGMYMRDYNNAALKLTGEPVITGNTAKGKTNNLYLAGAQVMTLENIGTGANVGITATSGRALSNALSSDLSDRFPSDDAAYTTILNADSQLQLKSSFVHVHCECGKENCTDTTHKQVEYEAWTNPNALPDTTGAFCLTVDVNITDEVEIQSDLTLCLNGHKVTGSTGKGVRFISTSGENNEVLTIADCTAKTVDGVYTAGGFYNNTNTHTGSGGGAIFIRAGATLKFYDGIVSGNATATGGAAFYIKNATAYFYNGRIENNKATYADKWYNGGAMYLDSAKVTIYNTVITGNEGNYGGAIHNTGASVLDIRGGQITGNIAHANGGAINATATACSTKLSGEPVITGNTLASGKVCNVRLAGTGIIDVADLGEKASIGVTANVFRAISTKTSDYAKNFISDDTKLTVIYQDEVLYMSASGDHKHCLCTGATANGCDHEKLLFVEWDDPTGLPSSGNYYLSVDVTIPSQARLEGAELNLCLNGHTIQVAENGGRAYYMTSGATLNISDCAGGGKFTDAKQGAILTNAKGTDMEINLYGGSFTGNNSNGSGGALVIQGDCTFNMYGGKITGNTSTGYLKLDDNGQPILDTNGDQDYQSCNGGGLYTGSGTIFNMYGGEISRNKVTEVEYLKAGATSTSKAGGIGGGVAVYGIANLYGGIITGNSGYTGGGVFVRSRGSVLNLLGTEISGNSATYGGGIISQTHSVVNMKTGLITGNMASGGAGIYVSTGTTLNMTGGEIVANEATGNGGGVYVLSSTVNLNGGAIKNNKANNGAGIYASATTSGGKSKAAIINVMEGALITGNYASTNGGGIMMSGKSDMTAGEGSKIVMTGGEISKNQGKNAGGILTQTKAAMELSGGKIVNNTAYSGGGGGVYISTGTKLTMTGGSINSNASAKSDGGGLYLYRSTGELKGGSINYNTAANGGGIKVSGAKATFSGVSIVGNKAVGKTTVDATTGESKVSGGNAGAIMIGRAGYKKNGVQLYDTPVVNVYSFYVADNTAVAAAGAILVQSKGTIFNMYGGTVTGNVTENKNGGGIYFSSNTINTITGGTFTGNKAKNAAAMYFLNCQADISGVKIYGNEASNAGGAFTVSGKTTTVNMKNAEIYDNAAGGAAGAVVVQSYATWNLEDTKIYGNTAASTAGAVYFSNPGYGNLKNVELYENQSLEKDVGAVYVGTNSIVTMDGVTVRNNKAATSGGGITNRGRLEITNSKVLNNEAGESGGGINTSKVASTLLADDAGVFAENVIISGNTSGGQGGGVYAHRGCPTYLTDCTITDNTSAAEGGGIFADGRLGLTDVTVTGNTSGGEGYAVYLTPSEFDGHSYQTGHKRIGGNMIIKDNQGGDMYLGEGTALAVTGQTLGEKSHVNITLHSGVLSQWVLGVYDYEGGDQVYTLTAGDRSITDPEPIPAEAEAEAEEEKKTAGGDVILYIGVGIFVLAIAAVIILLLTKKKKAAKTATEASKE